MEHDAAQHILAADIGGTNCRFGHFTLTGGRLALCGVRWLRTADMPHTDALLDAWAEAAGFPPDAADALVAAVAGPVADGLQGALTNAPLRLDLRGAQTRRGIRRCRVINDFTAEAYACLTEIGARARVAVAPEVPAPDAALCPKGVLGAGTGLGMASLLRDAAGTWLAVPSEGGHAAFPFAGDEEAAFQRFLCRELNFPYARREDVLAGAGLGLLHRFLTGERLGAREVGEQALSRDSATLRWYARFYARVCRDWILTTLCRGGLYIAGGIAARNPLLTACPQFREELRSSPCFAALLRAVPVFLVEDKNSGLWGAARAAQTLLET